MTWTADWLWGLPLTALTLTLHIAAVMGIVMLLSRVGMSVEQRLAGRRGAVPKVIAAIGAAGLALTVLHGLEAGIWAAAYLGLGAIGTPADAVLYSLDSLTTRGASGLALARQWKLMGAVESVNGVLLFGISTAFLAAMMTQFWSLIQSGTSRTRPKPDMP